MKIKTNFKWIATIFVITFILSTVFSYISTDITENLEIGMSIVVLLVIIFIGVIGDLVAVSVTAADVDALHAKASDKKKGAKTAIKLIKSANKVSSICADVIGDICGILSGSVGVLIALNISQKINIELSLVSLIMGGMIAALTVTGKALLKQFGMQKANEIVFFVGKILEFYKK